MAGGDLKPQNYGQMEHTALRLNSASSMVTSAGNASLIDQELALITQLTMQCTLW